MLIPIENQDDPDEILYSILSVMSPHNLIPTTGYNKVKKNVGNTQNGNAR